MTRIGKIVGISMGLLAAGAVSFFGARVLFRPEAASGAPNPVVTLEKARQALSEDNAKPRFTGEMNGITFKSPVLSPDLGCPEDSAMVDATPEQIRTSPLNFTAAYLPPGASLAGEAASACAGRVASLAKRYLGQGWEVTIGRYSGKVAPADAPIDRLEKVEVRGKQAVHVKGLPQPGMVDDSNLQERTLVVNEDFGVTLIEAAGLSLQEVKNIAEGLK